MLVSVDISIVYYQLHNFGISDVGHHCFDVSHRCTSYQVRGCFHCSPCRSSRLTKFHSPTFFFFFFEKQIHPAQILCRVDCLFFNSELPVVRVSAQSTCTTLHYAFSAVTNRPWKGCWAAFSRAQRRQWGVLLVRCSRRGSAAALLLSFFSPPSVSFDAPGGCSCSSSLSIPPPSSSPLRRDEARRARSSSSVRPFHQEQLMESCVGERRGRRRRMEWER